MRIVWLHIIAPLVTGVVSGLVSNAATWVGVSQALLSVVAIISAGVLVRLARGVPFTAIDVLEAEEARKLSKAIKQSVRGLRALLVVCFVTLLALVFMDHVNAVFLWVGAKGWLPFYPRFDYVAFLIPFFLIYLFLRTYSVVDGDVEIADIQADILVKKRGAESASKFQNDVIGPAKEGFRQPENYGDVVERD